MSEHIKYILNELSKPPYNKNYNIISFDTLGTEDRLQILTDILGEIDNKNKVDVRSEEPEETTVRLLKSLRVLKYDPGPDAVAFRQGLVQGEKNIINPILEWLLKNLEDLKKRAYLAEYLVKIEIPLEIAGDADIVSLFETYEQAIEEFKNTHKEYETIKSEGRSTDELRADIETMEKEKDIVVKRTERLMRKLDGVENKEAIVDAVRNLRLERERQRELFHQRQEELNLIEELQSKTVRLSQELTDLRINNQKTTPQSLIKQLEEEYRVNEYFVRERLPQDIERANREIEIMKEIASSPPLSQSDIAQIKRRVEVLSEEVNELTQKDVVESAEDKSVMARQQAVIAQRKKEQLADEYNRLKNELDRVKKEIQKKQKEGDNVVTEEEFKDYVSKLKVRSTLFKAKKAELAALISESGILARTIDILNQQKNSYSTLQFGDEDKKDLKLDEMSKDEIQKLISEVYQRITEEKSKLQPLIEELRHTREHYNEVLEEYTQKKKLYDAASAKLDSSTAKLKQEVKHLRMEYQKADSEVALLTAKTDIAETMLQRAQDEFVRYSEKGSINSLRERLSEKISEQERLNRELKDQQMKVRESQEKLAKQRSMWQNLGQLLECKYKCMESQKRHDGVVTREEGAETLVLQ